jgi:hypothetical protein
MTKKAIIEVTLVNESYQTTNREIEDEIALELLRNLQVIPWAERIEKIRVKGIKCTQRARLKTIK